MQIKNKKISELEEAQDMNGFFTIGYRIVNGVKTSLKFGLEKVQIAYDGMLAIKDNALDAICDIRALEEVVETSESNRVAAEQDRKTEYGGVIQSLQQAGETSSAQTALAKNATDAASAAAASANNAVTGIDAKMQDAIDALIAGAPGALDTLNELAAALGNDPNFATTVLNELGKKLNRADIINDLVSGGIDKPFSAEMGKLLKSTLDTHNHDGKYQPISNDIAKVYQTTLSLNSIDRRDNKAATQEEIDEVLNILAKYRDGYIVTVVEDNDYPYHYGVLNVGMMDDAMPITLIHYNDVGDVMAYMLESPSVGALWVVSNKTSSKVYVSPFKFNEVTSGSFLTEDQKRIITDINVNYDKGYIVVMSETSITNFKFGVINFAHSATTGTTLSIVNVDGDLIAYHLDGTSVGASRWTVTNKTTGGGGGSGESKVYKTTLNFKTISHGSALTAAQVTEVENIMDKYVNGYCVTYLENPTTGASDFSAGTVSVTMTTVTFALHLTVQINGNLITYSADGSTIEESIWKVTKHTSKTKFTITDYRFDLNGGISFAIPIDAADVGANAIFHPILNISIDGVKSYMLYTPSIVNLSHSSIFIMGASISDNSFFPFMLNITMPANKIMFTITKMTVGNMTINNASTAGISVQII